MNFARIKTSPRLQKVLLYLRRKAHHGATTMELIRATGQCAINSIMAELRRNGFEIACKLEGVTPDGGKVFRYTLVGA